MARDEKYEEMQKTILLLKAELERLNQPPYITGTVLDLGKKAIRVSVDNRGVYEVPSDSKLNSKLKRGDRVVLNPITSAIIDYSEFNDDVGELVSVDEVTDGKLRVNVKGEQRMILSAVDGVKGGDEVLLDPSGMLAIKKSENKKTKYNLEEIPNAPWENIGGLEDVIGKIKAEVEEPFFHKEIFERYGRKPIKGLLLYGPPGCGKTMIAKSIAYNLSKQNRNGKNGLFISVKGPEILEKWVGNSEANIRRIYKTARETAQDTESPVIVFVDEAESVLKTRGSGISTDIYDSIVPQFLAELDGIDGNGNVITVLASNREDIIDSAVLRDGRVDRRIKVPRPNAKGAKEIFQIYLKNKPTEGKAFFRGSERFADDIVNQIYDDKNIAYNVVSPREGLLGNFGYRHLISGAMIKGIVDRACGYAIRREIDSKKKSGITQGDLKESAQEEFLDNMGFSQNLVRDDWESVFGAKGKYYHDLYLNGYLAVEKAENSELNSTGGKTKWVLNKKN